MRLLRVFLLCFFSGVVMAGESFAYADVVETGTLNQISHYNANTAIETVIKDPVFEENGRYLFPLNSSCFSGETLKDLSLFWYTRPNIKDTLNILKSRVTAGEHIFIDIYTDTEKRKDPSKSDVKLIFFKGKNKAKTAILNAGGGFVYVGAMHDSFPHALELSKRGYNAFALIYRAGSQNALSDLAHALVYLYEHQNDLEIDMNDYSLWGGSAGARMATILGTEGTSAFGLKSIPLPAAVIMQYTSYSNVSGGEVPTYSNVGNADGIVDYRVMRRRMQIIQDNGTDTMFELFDGLPHGFGIGRDTVAFGWLDRAITFWEMHMNTTK